jgi:lysyl-tRNA synthetase class 2
MEQCEALVQALADRICMGQRLTFRGQEVDLRGPWERISVKEAFERYTQSSMVKRLRRIFLMNGWSPELTI